MTVNHRPLGNRLGAADPATAMTVEVAAPGRSVSGAAELETLSPGAVIFTEVRRVTETWAAMVPVVAVRMADGWLPSGAPYPVTSESIAEVSRSWSVLRRPTRRVMR